MRAERIPRAGASTVRNHMNYPGLRRFTQRAIFAGVFSLALLGCYQEGDEEPGYTPKTYAYAMNRQAIAELHAGRIEEALAAANRAIAHDPGYALAYSAKAAILARLGRQEEGAAVLENLTKLQPDLAEAHMAQGIFLEKIGDEKEARAAYARAVELYEAQMQAHKDAPESGVNHAIASFLLSGKVAGIRAIDKVVEAYPDYRPAMLVKDRILHGGREFFFALGGGPGNSRRTGRGASGHGR